jgi:hypothetical protein
MTEGNGSGNSRLDRIEALQEAFVQDMQLLLRAQVVMQGQMEEQQKQREQDRRDWQERARQLDERVDKLVAAMGEFIRKGSEGRQ